MLTVHDPLMIVSDLDGSLLDHHTYSWDSAQPWLDRLNEAGIPLVICSSKTAAEILPLQRALGIVGAPFISENGAVVSGGNLNDVPSISQRGEQDYGAICETIQRLRAQYGFKLTGFHDVTDKEVADWTGLTTHNAALAKMREGSETIIWRDTAENFAVFCQVLASNNLILVQGGRFWHVMNKGSSKGAALAWLLRHIPSPSGRRYITIGLGDGPNDAPMLDSVDYAVIIKGYSKTAVTLQRKDKENIFHSAHFGPEGWSEGLAHFIAQD